MKVGGKKFLYISGYIEETYHKNLTNLGQFFFPMKNPLFRSKIIFFKPMGWLGFGGLNCEHLPLYLPGLITLQSY
jgi:hypothetical protein